MTDLPDFDLMFTDPATGEQVIVDWKTAEGVPLRIRDAQLEMYRDLLPGVIIETAEEHAARIEQEEEDELAERLATLHLPGAHDDWDADLPPDDEVDELQRRLEADPMHDPVFFHDGEGEER